jgi:hypothetical protein
MDVKTLMYIQSEAEFDRARWRGFWEIVQGTLTRNDVCLLSFNKAVSKLGPRQVVDLGIQDIPMKAIVGSVGRGREFTRRFLPRVGDRHSRERWRNIFTLAVTGVGLPPIQVFKLGEAYFVRDGHHRVSVAGYLNWTTIQAYVTILLVNSEAEVLGGSETVDEFDIRN